METTTTRSAIELLKDALRKQREELDQQKPLSAGRSDPGFKFFAARGRTLTPDADAPDVDAPDVDVPQPRLRVEGEPRPEPQPVFKTVGGRIGQEKWLSDLYPSPFPLTEERKPDPVSGVVQPASATQLKAVEAAKILRQAVEADVFKPKETRGPEMLADSKLRDSWIVQDPIGALFEVMFYVGEQLEKIDKPAAALFMSVFNPRVKSRAAELREQGVSDLDAAKIAYEEQVPEWMQWVADVGLSPVNLVPVLGFPGMAAKIAGKTARVGTKTAGAVGRTVSRVGLQVEWLDDLGMRVASPAAARDVVRAPIPSSVVKPVEGQFAAGLLNLVDVMNDVRTSTNRIARTVTRGINPSVSNDTPIGIVNTAYQRQIVAAEEMAELAVSAALDPHAQRFTGRGNVLGMNKDGFIGDVRWEDVASRPGDYNLTPNQLAYLRDMRQVIDEMEALRVAAGLDPRAMTKEGWYYVPRQVSEARGIQLTKPSSAGLARVWETATEGAAAGVKYSNDPRSNLMLHVRAAYREIADKQMTDAMESLSVAPSKLVKSSTRAEWEQAAHEYTNARATASRLRAGIATTRATFKAAARKNRRSLDRQIDRLEEEIQNLFKEVVGPAKVDPQAGTSAADLHARLLRSPVRANGFAASSEAAAKAYFANLRRFIQKVAPDDRDLQAVVDRAEDAYFSGDIAKATATAESALSQGHMIGGASFPDEDLFVRFTQQVESEALRFPAGSELRDLAERHALLRKRRAALKSQRTKGTKRPIIPEQLSARSKAADAKEVLLKPRYDAAKKKWQAELDAAKHAEIAPGNLFGKAADNISVKMWRNNFLPREDADLLEQVLRRTPPTDAGAKVLRFGERLTSTVRTLESTLDFAMPFIQGLPVLAKNPAAWGKATLLHYQAFFDPTVQGRFMREHLETIQTMARNQVPVGDPEFFAALRPGEGFSPGALLGFLPGGDEARRLLRFGGKQSFGRFQASYSMGLNANRTLLWEAMAKSKSWKGTDAELGRYIRNMTGGLNSRSLGAGPTQRSIESMFLAFSPRLFRSTVALVGDALQIRGANAAVARASLGRLTAGVTGLYVLSGLGLGKSWEEIGEGLNPLNGKKFLSHQINGQWIGVGGQVRAIAQVLAKTGVAIYKREPIQWNNQFENPLLAGYMNRGAVGTNIVLGIGETFTRRDLLAYDNLESTWDLVKFLGTSMLPFAVQGKIEGEGVTAMLAGGLGSRASAETPFEAVDRLRLEEMQNRGLYTPPVPAREDLGAVDDFVKGFLNAADHFDDLDLDIRADIDRTPAVKAALEVKAQRQREGGSDYQEYKDERQLIDDTADEIIVKAIDSMGPGQNLRRRIGELNRDRSRDKNALRERSEEALAFLDDLEPDEGAFHTALEAYIDVVTAEDIHDVVSGDVDFDLRAIRLEELEAEHGKEMIKRVVDHFKATDPPMVKLLTKHQNELKPFFDITRDVVREHGGAFMAKRYKEFQRLEPNERTNFLNENDDVRLVHKTISERRLAMRSGEMNDSLKEKGMNGLRIDALRAIWYGSVPKWDVLKDIFDNGAPDGHSALLEFVEREWTR
jgi:hypothetical protein